MEPLTDEEKARFIEKLTIVNKPLNANVTQELHSSIKEELNYFFKKSIREKIEFLDGFNDDERYALSLVGKTVNEWICTKDAIFSVDIRTVVVQTSEDPFGSSRPQEPRKEETPEREKSPSESAASSTSKDPVKKPAKSRRSSGDFSSKNRRKSMTPQMEPVPEEVPKEEVVKKEEAKPEDPEPDMFEEEYDLQKPGRLELEYRAIIGRLVTVSIEGTRRKVFQKVHLTFSEDDQGYTHLKRWIETDADVHREDDWPKENVPEIGRLNARGVIHESAKYLSEFFASHKNYTDTLYIDVDLWSEMFKFPSFRHVNNFTIRHKSIRATQWWMTRIRTYRTIPNMRILKNYPLEGDEPTKECKNYEAMPYIVPFEGREIPGWVEVVSYCEYALFYAKTLTVEPVIGMSLADVSMLPALAELNINMRTFSLEEVKLFLADWQCGNIAPRFGRLTVHYDDPFDYPETPDKHELPENMTWKLLSDDNDVPQHIRDLIVLPNVSTYVIFRNWPRKPYPAEKRSRFAATKPGSISETRSSGSSEQEEEIAQAAGSQERRQAPVVPSPRKKEPSTSSTASSGPAPSSDSGISSDHRQDRRANSSSSPTSSRASSEKTLPKYYWLGGACCILQIDSEKKDVMWTAVHNEKIADDLIRYYSEELKSKQSTEQSPNNP